MAEVTVWSEAIPYSDTSALLRRECPVRLPVSDRRSVIGDREDAAASGDRRHLAELEPEGRQQLLRHPTCAK